MPRYVLASAPTPVFARTREVARRQHGVFGVGLQIGVVVTSVSGGTKTAAVDGSYLSQSRGIGSRPRQRR